jgi:Short C-terminal domain
MQRMARSRDTCFDLLAPRPQSWATPETWAGVLVDSAAQLRELAALVAQGLMTDEEFERQRRKVLGP